MTSDADTVALLERALDQTAAIIAAISASEAGLATPCPGWDVAALVRHLTGQDLRNFLASARGEAADWQAPADELGQDWAADFRDRAARLMAVWQQADLDRQLSMPGGGQSVAQPRRSADRRAGHAWLGPGSGHRPAADRPGPGPGRACAALVTPAATARVPWARPGLRPGGAGPAGCAGLRTAGRLVRPRPQLDATRQHGRSPALTPRFWLGRSTAHRGRTLLPAHSAAGPG